MEVQAHKCISQFFLHISPLPPYRSSQVLLAGFKIDKFVHKAKSSGLGVLPTALSISWLTTSSFGSLILSISRISDSFYNSVANNISLQACFTLTRTCAHILTSCLVHAKGCLSPVIPAVILQNLQ